MSTDDQTQGRADGETQAAIDRKAIDGAKQLLRKAIVFRRASRADEQRVAADDRRMSIMESALRDRTPKTVAAYLSAGVEPGTLQLIAWLAAHNVTVLLPALSHPVSESHPECERLDGPAWAPYQGPDSLRVGAYSILEPIADPVPPEQLSQAELIICPGLAGNSSGDRLGRGGGWYDRALGHASPGAPVWLLLNDDEVLESIPVQPWDRRVDLIITPTRMITTGNPPVR